MTNPHRVIQAINTVPSIQQAHFFAYAVGMTTELHDKAGIPDEDSIRLENDPSLIDDLSNEIKSGYRFPATYEEIREEVMAQIHEWEELSIIWDAVIAEFPGYGDRYRLNIDHLEMNSWNVTMRNRDGKEIYFTYLLRNGKAERQ